MLMHVITNFTANAGAEAMLGRLLQTAEGDLVVPLMDVSDRYRNASPASIRYRPLRASSAGTMAKAVPRLARMIDEEAPDAVLCWMYHAMVVGTLAAKLSKRPTRLYWNVRQSLDDRSVLSFSTKTALYASRFLSSLPEAIVFNSERAMKLHGDFGYRNPNMRFIPNGFEIEDQAPPVPRDVRVFGIAARFSPQKDHRTFFQAAAIVARARPDARFVAAGAGMSDDNEAILGMIAESGLPMSAMTLLGECRDMRRFYQDIDVLVLSSRTEGFPNVIGEAMSAGRPVVATDVGDAAAIAGPTGIVVPPGDPSALAMALRSMLDLTPAGYAALSHAARNRIAERYSMRKAAAEFEELVGRPQEAFI